MKTFMLLGIAGVTFLSLAQPTWAGPRGGGGGSGSGGHVGGGGRVGGFAGGGSRAAPAFNGGGFRGAPAFRGAYFTGRSTTRPSSAPRFYYGGNRMSVVQPHGSTRAVTRSTSPYTGRVIAANRQPSRVRSNATATRLQSNRVSSNAGLNRLSDPRVSTARSREFVRNHASERHSGDWHRDWDRHHAHFHNNRVFVFVGGFWWGLYPWDYYPYYASGYPYDYYGNYPYDSSGYPDDYSSGYNPYDYYQGYNDYDSTYAAPDQNVNNSTVSAVQSQLAKLGYYNGAIDGTLGDQTEAALARYQEDSDLSVSGTVDAATLQSLGIR
jgi:Putative peptidoglycan binding domain